MYHAAFTDREQESGEARGLMSSLHSPGYAENESEPTITHQRQSSDHLMTHLILLQRIERLLHTLFRHNEHLQTITHFDMSLRRTRKRVLD